VIEQCSNCRFSGKLDENGIKNFGRNLYCARYPPVFGAYSNQSNDVRLVWTSPPVFDTEWCGEWQMKTDENPA
jgi:hypothetical protein